MQLHQKLIWNVHFLTSCNRVCERSVSWKVFENAFFESWKTLEFGLCKSWKVLENSLLMSVRTLLHVCLWLYVCVCVCVCVYVCLYVYVYVRVCVRVFSCCCPTSSLRLRRWWKVRATLRQSRSWKSLACLGRNCKRSFHTRWLDLTAVMHFIGHVVVIFQLSFNSYLLTFEAGAQGTPALRPQFRPSVRPRQLPQPKEGGYVLICVCLSVCFAVCLTIRLLEKLWSDFSSSFSEGRGTAQGPSDWILVAIQIAVRIQEFWKVLLFTIAIAIDSFGGCLSSVRAYWLEQQITWYRLLWFWVCNVVS